MERNYNYNRSNYSVRHTSRHFKFGNLLKKINKKTFDKMINQLIISLVISFIVIVVSNLNGSFVNSILDGIRWITGTNYDFASAVNSIMPGINNKINEIPGLVGDIFDGGETVDAVSDSIGPLMIMPVEGEITAAFKAEGDSKDSNDSEISKGIIIAAEEGTPIKSVMDGIILKIEESQTLGRVVRIKHNEGLETLYAHCSEILVDEGQTVKQGEYVAKVGHTGSAEEPELYFEVIKEGIQIDPLTVIGNTAQAK